MGRDSMITGLALFAMFFGAGNLIFPPYLGLMSGTQWIIAFLCFVFIDVVLSCVGIFALNAAGGPNVAIFGAVGKVPGLVLNTAAVLCTGVLIAAPRTAATTYEMGVVPLMGSGVPLWLFSILFFAAVFLLTYHKSKVVDIIGKYLTPILVLGIAVLIIAGLANPPAEVAPPTSQNVARDGIIAGYQAMDILCVVGYALVVMTGIRELGYKDRPSQLKMMAYSSIIAAVLLFFIYGGLTYLGSTSGIDPATGITQAELLVHITRTLLGTFGVVLLGIVVAAACLTTAIGLIGATASYFESITHSRISYKGAVVVVTAVCLVICNMGLTDIIRFAEPVLAVICPPFMATVILILFRNQLRSPWIYKGAALGAFAMSLIIEVHNLTGAFSAVENLPLYSYGFAWLPFAVAGGVIGAAAARLWRKRKATCSVGSSKGALGGSSKAYAGGRGPDTASSADLAADNRGETTDASEVLPGTDIQGGSDSFDRKIPVPGSEDASDAASKKKPQAA